MHIVTFSVPHRPAPFMVIFSGLKRIGSGGVAKVYEFVSDTQNSYALKIYNDPSGVNWDRIEALIELGKTRINDELSSGDIAWPLGIVFDGSRRVGVALRLYENNQYTSLDEWIEFSIANNLSAHLDSLPTRLRISANLSALLEYAHQNSIAIVDLKPSNVFIGKKDLRAIFLDADSFGFFNAAGKKFPPTHVSANYINPNSYSPQMNISQLWHDQDLYALAVIIFQILNFGIHPFQSVLRQEIEGAGTNDEKASLGLYAYGQSMHVDAAPLKTSVHASWPPALRQLFDAAFVPGRTRPTASEWRDTLAGILDNKEMQRCQVFPDDVRHIHFGNCRCSRCMLVQQRATNKYRTPDAKVTPQSMPAAAPNPWASALTNAHPTMLKPCPKLGSSGVIIALIIFIFFVVLILPEIFKKATPQIIVPSVMNYSNYQSIEKNDFYGMSSYAVCESAVTIDGLNWASPRLGELLSPNNRPYYEHAKQIAIYRGYSLQFCASQFYEYGVSASVPTDARRPWSANSDKNICEHALNLEPTGWQNSPARVEARIRRLTLADCLEALNVPAPQVPTGPITPPQAPSTAAQVEATYKAREDALGLTRDQWRGIQTALQDLGFQPGPLDGLPGRGTRSALMNFQKAAFGAGTGYVDNGTLNVLPKAPSALGFEPLASAYEGEFLAGRRNGRGTLTWPNGNRYVGDFRDGQRTGHGTYMWPNGDRYVGEFRDGQMTGQGIYTWPDGSRWHGEWLDGRRNGRGVYTRPNGVSEDGVWANDQLQ